LKRWLIVSFIIHSFFFLTPPSREKENIAISYKHSIKGSYKRHKKSLGNTELTRAINEYNEESKNPLQKKEFLYTNFFDRIREKIYLKWSNCVRQRDAKRIYHETLIRVILTNKGMVSQVFLVKTTKDGVFVKCALDSFKGTGPFENPPNKLIDFDGFIRINWLFYINEN